MMMVAHMLNQFMFCENVQVLWAVFVLIYKFLLWENVIIIAAE